MNNSIYLASGSPRRFELLQQLGFLPIKISAAIDETPYTNEKAIAYTERMALEKSQQAILNNPDLDLNKPVLTADTSVALDNHILGKPNSEQDAVDMLTMLSNSTHQVITSICIFHQNQRYQVNQISDVTFKALSQSEIAAYVQTGEPMDKAGSYGIQGYGAIFVSHLNGSYTGVMGLPLFETAKLLNQCGFSILNMLKK